MQAELGPLSCRYDVVVANPPYMGSSNMNGWVSKWVKKNYPIAKSDLCTCFFNRAQQLAKDDGYISMITASSWMFISSFEKFRKKLLAEGSICSMIQQSTHGYAGVTVPTTMFTYACHRMGVIGSYIRLEDFDRPQWQEPRALEALADPDCGWFYRAAPEVFSTLPGAPITYWTASGFQSLCRMYQPLEAKVAFKEGITTGDNDTYLRLWHEIGSVHFACSEKACPNEARFWVPCNKGGSFRRWYGNNDYVIDWTNNGNNLASFPRSSFRNSSYQRKQGVSYSNLSSGRFAARYSPEGFAFESKGTTCFSNDFVSTLAYLNSSLFGQFAKLVCPTLDFKFGVLQKLPDLRLEKCDDIGTACVQLAKDDWDSFETSWNFVRHPLV